MATGQHRTRSTKNSYGEKRRVYNPNQRAGESDMAYYHRLAKAADERMRRLAKLSEQPGFERVKKYAYSVAMRDIQTFTPGGKTFDVNPPQDERLFKEKLAAMRHFLELPTSTKAGIIETYQKRVDTFNKTYGTDFTWQDLADYFNKGYADKVAKSVGGSKTALYAIGIIKTAENTTIEGILNNKSITVDDVNVDAAVKLLSTSLKIPGTDYDMQKRAQARKQLKELQAK